MKNYLFVVFVCCFLFIQWVSSEVIRKSANLPFDAVQCEACQAALREIDLKVSQLPAGKKNRELQVMEIIEGVCEPRKLTVYKFAPPKMGPACSRFVESNDEALQKIFFKGNYNLEAVSQKFCLDSGLCQLLWADEPADAEEAQGYKIDVDKEHAKQIKFEL